MKCNYHQFCGQEGAPVKLIKGTGEDDFETLSLCPDCLLKLQETVKRMTSLPLPDMAEIRAREITEKMDRFISFEEEILKLFCLVQCCATDNGIKDYLHKDYLKEKISRIMSKKPLILDNSARAFYFSIKIGTPQQNPFKGEEVK